MNPTRLELIRHRLQEDLRPLELEIQDDSAQHRGHAGARDGRGHYSVRIRTPAFADLSRLERHRLVYAALGELMQTDIHALSIVALAPGETH
ncbi:MAG TPA: BolA family protein [Gammaproteobacteria bacterium]|nr:BolA family protein [Gammaproteobacteria bacterium]